MKYVRRILAVLAVVATIVLLLRYWPGSRLHVTGFEIIAHRGVHPGLHVVDRNVCTAALTRHSPHIENTLPSIAAAFDAGADLVEIDLHGTSDGHVVVFHDWSVDCKTNGAGVTDDQTLAYLKSLDVGYGYTADGGATFPFRGTAIGAMQTLEEVLAAFPDRRFLLDHKSGTSSTTQLIANVLRRYPPERLRKLNYWGPRYDELRALIPAIGDHVLDRRDMKRCAYDYMKSLGIGDLPASCTGKTLMLPRSSLRWVWGSRSLHAEDRRRLAAPA